MPRSAEPDLLGLAQRTCRVLLTGGCGFVGSALVRHLISETSAEVLNLDKLTYAGNLAAVAAVAGSPRYRFSRLDVCDSAKVASEIAAFEPDLIIHLAAESHVDRSIDESVDFVQTNLVGTHTLLEGARCYWRGLPDGRKRQFRFVHVSTDEVYGTLDLDKGKFVEESPYRPNSPYAATKAGSDHLARAWHRTYDLPIIISNCCNNFGPFQFPEKLIPTTIIAALEGRPLPVYGTGANVRDWLFVEDHVRALVALAERGVPGATYLVGGDAELTNLDLVKQLCRILDRAKPASPHRPHEQLIQFVPDRPGHDLRYAVDSTRLRTELGWSPRQSLALALERTVLWYLENRDWWEELRRVRYDGRRLGISPLVSQRSAGASPT